MTKYTSLISLSNICKYVVNSYNCRNTFNYALLLQPFHHFFNMTFVIVYLIISWDGQYHFLTLWLPIIVLIAGVINIIICIIIWNLRHHQSKKEKVPKVNNVTYVVVCDLQHVFILPTNIFICNMTLNKDSIFISFIY